MQKRKLLYLALASIIGLFVLFVLAPMTGLPLQGQRLLALLAFIVVVWSTEAVSYPVSALVLVVLITLCYMNPASMKKSMDAGMKAALSGLSGTTPLLCMAATAFAFIVQKCGLSQRAVFNILKLISGKSGTVKASRMLLSFFCVEVPMSVMVPAATGRAAIYLSLAEAMQKPFGFKKLDNDGMDTGGNPFQKGIYILCGLLPGMMGAAFLTASPLTLMAGQLIADGSGVDQTWIGTAILLVPPALLLLISFYFLLLKIYPSTVDDIPMSFVEEKLKELGPMGFVEKYVFVVFFITLGFWVTDKWHGIPLEATMISMVIAFYIPYIGPGNWKADSKSFAWNTMLIVGVSLGFVRALTQNGVMKFIASWLGTFNVTNILSIMLLVLAVLIILRIAVSSNTGAAVLFIPLAIELGKHANLPAGQLVCLGWVVYVFCRAGFLLPQQGSQPMLAYEFGYFSRMDQLRLGVPLMAVALVIYIVWCGIILPQFI